MKTTLALDALRIVSFGVGVDLEQQHNLLIALLQQPELLPHLQTISFAEYPSFMLLVRTLFRRNITRPLGCKNGLIKEVKLPALPSSNVLLRLASILAQKIAPAEVRVEELPEQDMAVYDLDM